jgi:peroxiredoxin
MDPSHPFAALEDAFARSRDMDAPLSERLQVIADAVRALSSTFADAVDTFVGRLQRTGAGQAAPGPGDMLPSFLMPDQDGRLVSLEQLLAKGPAVVAFHRGHWCPYCRLNAVALQEIQDEIGPDRVVVITPENRKYTSALRAESGAAFPILTDIDNGYALSINLAIWVDEAMSSLIDAAGWNIPTYQGNDSWILPIPAAFVLDSDGRIVARHVDPDYRQRMDIRELLAAFNAAR